MRLTLSLHTIREKTHTNVLMEKEGREKRSNTSGTRHILLGSMSLLPSVVFISFKGKETMDRHTHTHTQRRTKAKVSKYSTWLWKGNEYAQRFLTLNNSIAFIIWRMQMFMRKICFHSLSCSAPFRLKLWQMVFWTVHIYLTESTSKSDDSRQGYQTKYLNKEEDF